MRRFAQVGLVVAVVVLIAAALGRWTREDAEPRPVVVIAPPAEAATTPVPTAVPVPTPPPAGRGLAVGVTEFNANLIAAPGSREIPAPWSTVRDKLGAIKPAYFRLVVDWASIQPSAAAPANMDAPQGGCMRAVQPCLGWAGMRDVLRALATRQRQGGWTTLVVITNTPDWAASPSAGCERPRATPRARPPRADALPAYQELLRTLFATAAQEGARLSYLSPWNEPNHPAFISPQRAACDPASPSIAPAAYAQIARAAQQVLAEPPATASPSPSATPSPGVASPSPAASPAAASPSPAASPSTASPSPGAASPPSGASPGAGTSPPDAASPPSGASPSAGTPPPAAEQPQLVLGETAGLPRAGRYMSSVGEFIAGLPDDLVCATSVWSQHAYVGGEDPVEQADAALRAHGCSTPHTIWITETGVGPAPVDLSAGGSIADPMAGCRALHDQLARWFADPRVTIAFQYTVREDDRFPVGLVSTDLSADRPALAEWTAWGGARAATDPPPPSTCGG